MISPSGLTIYSSDLFPEWRGNFLIGGLSSRALVRLVLEDDRVVGEERLLTDRGERIRDVVQGPDGALYLLTDDEDGALLKVTPRDAWLRVCSGMTDTAWPRAALRIGGLLATAPCSLWPQPCIHRGSESARQPRRAA